LSTAAIVAVPSDAPVRDYGNVAVIPENAVVLGWTRPAEAQPDIVAGNAARRRWAEGRAEGIVNGLRQGRWSWARCPPARAKDWAPRFGRDTGACSGPVGKGAGRAAADKQGNR